MGEWKYDDFLAEGKKVEERFKKDLVEQYGGKILEASEKDDKKYHIDVRWEPPEGRSCSFDVKGLKKNKRSDKQLSSVNTWVEFKNVFGKKGWLYGEEDYVAFETLDEWLVVRTKNFANVCETSVKDNGVIATVLPNKDFMRYQRNGRKDVIMRVPISFIKENAVKIISKNLNNNE